MTSRLLFQFSVDSPRAGTRREPDQPMAILVMGNFRGQNSDPEDSSPPLPSPIPVDIDNFEQVLRRLSPRLSLEMNELGSPPLEISINEIDDFRPDELLEKLPLFNDLKSLRRRLLDPNSFEDAARQLEREGPSLSSEARVSEQPKQARDSGQSLFEGLLGGQPSNAQQTSPSKDQSPTERLIKQLISTEVGPAVDETKQGLCLSVVDDAISQQMRRILHSKDFQELESCWRSLHDLVMNITGGEEIRLYLLDASKRALSSDIETAADDISASGLYRIIIESGKGTLRAEPFSLIIGNYQFEPNGDDATLLAALGTIAGRVNAVFLGGADPLLLGCSSSRELSEPRRWAKGAGDSIWNDLRQTSAARSIGLALPRVLVRRPYGAHSDPLDVFEFEEFTGKPQHENYLWGNPAFTCATLLAHAFQDRGWEMEPGDQQDVIDLPTYVFETDEGRQMQPCSEVLLSEQAVDAILREGLIPVHSYKDRNAVHVPRFHSIADPAAPLFGPWRPS